MKKIPTLTLTPPRSPAPTSRGATPVTISVFSDTLTLKDAEAFVAANPRNRPISRLTVEQYTDDILNERWPNSGGTIKLNADLEMLDGQHRCLALIEANKINPAITELPIPVLMGYTNDSQDYMDIGRQRTVADQLSMRGKPYAGVVSAAARHVVAYQINGGAEIIRHISHPKILKWVTDHPEIQDYAQVLSRHTANSSAIPVSGLVAAMWLLVDNGADAETVADFMNSVKTGANLPADDPVLALRTRTINAQTRNEDLNTTVRFLMVLRAWNMWRRGEKAQRFPIRAGNGGKLILPGSLEK